MSNSQFCIQQRQKEQQQLKKLLVFGFASSTLIHGILAYALPRWSFESSQVVKPIEIVIVDKIKPKPKPKVESKPIVEPKPTPVEPSPVAPTPPPPVEPPPVAPTPPPPVEPPPVAPTPPPPVEPPPVAQTPPPKPVPKTPTPKTTPKKVLTTPTPAPSQPIVPAPVENTAQPSSVNSSSTAPSSSSETSSESKDSPDTPSSAVATNSAPPRPEASSEPVEGISCIDNCEPEYPTALAGVEGSASVKLTIDRDGNVMVAELATTDSNSQVSRQALLAARQMQFSSPGDEPASVQVKIDFTVEGSEYDRARREEEKSEQAKEERQEQEAARQQQLEAEQQAKQEQLEREQARQQQLQQQQESTPSPVLEAEPAPKLPTLSPEKLDEAMQRGLGGSPHERLHQEERLRKFKERMENYQEE